MRLFVAITPPADALDEVEALVAPLRAAWPGLRFAGHDSWHVTLAFLGEVRDGVLPELHRRLERAAHRHPGVELSISGAGAFPAAAKARVLWAGIHGDQRALTGLARLAASVSAGARRAGAPPPDEHRRYRPHLTVARCGKVTDASELVEQLAGFAGLAWRAGQVDLIRSYPGPRPRYETVGAWPLRAAPDFP